MPDRSRRALSNLNRLVYFAAVVDAGSFTRAATALGITKAVVSQQVAKLEEEVGTALLVRTTRSVHATDAGRALHARCGVILRESAEAFDELAEGVDVPRGTLRVTAPFDYGTAVVVPLATELTRLHPRCKVVVTLSDRALDTQTHDLAVRVGWPSDSSLKARRIGAFEQRLVGAPSVLKKHRLRAPEDAAKLSFVANASLNDPLVWTFTRGADDTRTVQMQSSIAIDATPAVYAAVQGGAGISVLPDYLVDGDVAAGRLVHVLPEWKLPSGGIYVLLPPTRFRPANVSHFMARLVQFEKERQARSGG